MTMRATRMCAAIASALLLSRSSVVVHSWSTPTTPNPQSRRDVLRDAALVIAGAVTVPSSAAMVTMMFGGHPGAAAALAAAPTPSSQELERLPLGHARVRYLLDHWDEITSVCGTTIMSDTERRQIIRTEGGGQCSKTPLRVQEFMGYKSTNDPLYRVDKLMVRASPLVDPDDFETYLDLVERYREKADATALLAYTSSWGEANPYVRL
jgi:hypothetical protein